MYRATEDGRNIFRFYNAELTRKAQDRLTLETELRRAIEQQEFVLHYQPRVDVSSGAIVGAEALIRWQHPQSGLVSPLRFIPLAEETGLILPLGEWVLKTACEQLSAWLTSGLLPMTLAVNLSPRQFQHRDLVKRLRAVLDATGLPPGLLELEITESAIMQRGQEAVTTLRALKDLGLKVAIDDFGTGYSSLAYLRRFPIDTLKIDQSFMRDIPRAPALWRSRPRSSPWRATCVCRSSPRVWRHRNNSPSCSVMPVTLIRGISTAGLLRPGHLQPCAIPA